jgi:alpha-ketoglutarate-dependent taurine dioxygenase
LISNKSKPPISKTSQTLTTTPSPSDLVHELHPAGITHLHNDVVPSIGGDTLWASGYAAYSKLSPAFRAFIDGKEAVYLSAHKYLDREDPTAGPKHIERVHPLVRVHPVTGWKILWVNRAFTTRIVGLDKPESDVVLGYLFDVYEGNIDIQVRWRWTSGTSVIWVSCGSLFFCGGVDGVG